MANLIGKKLLDFDNVRTMNESKGVKAEEDDTPDETGEGMFFMSKESASQIPHLSADGQVIAQNLPHSHGKCPSTNQKRNLENAEGVNGDRRGTDQTGEASSFSAWTKNDLDDLDLEPNTEQEQEQKQEQKQQQIQEQSSCDQVNRHIHELQQYLSVDCSNSKEQVRDHGCTDSSNPAKMIQDCTDDTNENNSSSDSAKVTKSNGPKDSTIKKSDFQCRFCKYEFVTLHGLRKHQGFYDVTRDGKNKCSKCSKVLYSKESLKRHIRIHTGEKPFECELCHDRFFDTSSLRGHKRTYHSPLHPIKCRHCGRTFQAHSRLAKHMSECNRAQLVADSYKNSDIPNRASDDSGEVHSSKALRCMVCVHSFPRCSMLKQHLEDEHSDYLKEVHRIEQRAKGKESVSVVSYLECMFCGEKFSTESNLRVHQTLTDVHVSEKKKFKCSQCPKELNSKAYLMIHMRYHTGEKPFECFLCHERFVDRSVLRKHERRYHPHPNSFKCDSCSQGFPSTAKLEKHISFCRRPQRVEDHSQRHPGNGLPAGRDGHSKPLTEQSMSLVNSEPIHVELGTVDSSQKSASFTSTKTCSPDDAEKNLEAATEQLRSQKHHSLQSPAIATQVDPKVNAGHSEAMTGPTKVLESAISQFEFGKFSSPEQQRDMDQAMDTLEPEQSSVSHQSSCTKSTFKCNVCMKVLNSAKMLRQHIKRHIDHKKFQCSLCNERFSYKYQVGNHQRKYHGPDALKCLECFQVFSRCSELNQHIEDNHPERMEDLEPEGALKCKHCGKVFNELKRFRDHLSTMSNKCTVCAKQFNSHGYLVLHMRLHTGERPVVCLLCPKSFVDSSALRKHERRWHSEQNSFKCSFCSEGFDSIAKLKRHFPACSRPSIENSNSEDLRSRPPNVGEGFPDAIAEQSAVDSGNLESSQQSLEDFSVGGDPPTKKSKISSESCLLAENRNSISTQKQEVENGKEGLTTGIEDEESGVQEEDFDVEGHKCSVCLEEFDSAAYLMEHSQIHTDKKTFQCGTCLEAFHLKHQLESHITNYHGPNSLECPVCVQVFPRCKMLQKHIEETHPEELEKDKELVKSNQATYRRVFQCSECLRVFKQEWSFKAHMNNHRKPPPEAKQIAADKKKDTSNQCHVCGKSFTTKGGLVLHSTLHLGVKPFPCSTCDKTFRLKSSLVNHKKRHGSKKIMCEMCSRCFYTKGELQKHQDISHQKPEEVGTWKCPICFKVLSSKISVINHRPMHYAVRERRFKCKICDYASFTSGCLKQHIRSHKGERKHSCDVCGKKFLERKHLKNHFKLHTGETPWKCDVCHKGFAQQAGLYWHKKRNKCNDDGPVEGGRSQIKTEGDN